MKNITSSNAAKSLLENLQEIVGKHRPVFKQERTFRRAEGLLLGELFSFARHTITQGLLALGIRDGDWSAWYRMFSHVRFDEAELNSCLMAETLEHVAETEPYVTAMDGTSFHRSSLKMPGTSWLIDKRFSSFRPGIHRAQRFLHGCWLMPLEAGYSRAVPLRLLPAFPEKAAPSEHAPQREWEAGLVFLKWVRHQLDIHGRSEQTLLSLADGAFDVLELWRGLPERTILVTRTARNRSLYWLPKTERASGPGRPPSYGERAPTPAAWLHAGLRNWPKADLLVRGRLRTMRYYTLGPFVREGMPENPVFLIVIKGMHRLVGQRKKRYKHKGPSFYLVSAVKQSGLWQLPLPIESLLAWLWQRWEIEVAHREMKSGFGVGEKQCWNRRAAVLSVQWSTWVYAVLLLAAYRTWGLCNGPPTPARWWPGAKRWSLTTMWRSYRAAFWNLPEFQALWTTTGDNWWEKEAWLASWSNSVQAAARI